MLSFMIIDMPCLVDICGRLFFLKEQGRSGSGGKGVMGREEVDGEERREGKPQSGINI